MNIRNSFAKTLVKSTAWVFGVALLLLILFHLWFITHSEKAMENLVAQQSNGKMKAVIKKFTVDYFNNEIEIKDLLIFNTDTLQGTSYRFTSENFKFKIRSKWDWIFHKQLFIDSVLFYSPDIVITRKKIQNDTTQKKLALAEELGDVYKTINTSLSVLKLQRFEINEGKIFIKDADDSSRAPFRLSHIFFSVDELNIDSTSANKFILSDRVLLRIAGQKVLLPDNKSNISFKELKLDSKEQYIQISNPSVNIFSSPEQKNSFIGSASRLAITGLDFNLLYKEPFVKIDSVFMENPAIDLQVYSNIRNKNTDTKKKISLDSALRILPVAVDINHVVIKNGSGAMQLHQAGKTHYFKTKNDNLSVSGLQFNDTAANIVSIAGFNYTIRNYIGYTPDSLYRFSFDSLQFINNKIILYNFIATTGKKDNTNLTREYTVPRFEITGLDWLSFIFYNHFKAEDAVLYNAVMKLEEDGALNIKKQVSNKKSIYQVLSVFDNMLALDELKIINGDFAFKQGANINLYLQKLNLDINAHQLTEAKSFNQLVRSVKELSFYAATVSNPGIQIHVSQSSFSNKYKNLLLKNVLLNASNKSISANLNDVALSDFSFDEDGLEVNGIHWQNGIINFSEEAGQTNKINAGIKTPAFVLNGIDANNTTAFFTNGRTTAQAFLKKVSAESFGKSQDNIFQLDGLLVTGDSAIISLPQGKINCDEFSIRDKEKSTLQHILFERIINVDTTLIQVPSFSFVPLVNETIANNSIVADSVEIEQPQVFLSCKNDTKKNNSRQAFNLPKLDVNGFNVTDATLLFHSINNDDKTIAQCEKASFSIQHILTQENKNILFDSIKLNTVGNVSYLKNDSISIQSNEGINIDAAAFLYYPGTSNWQLQLNKLDAANSNYSNKRTVISIAKLNMVNTDVTNDDLTHPLSWLINKSNATISADSIHLQKSGLNLIATNTQFNQGKKHLIIGSFNIDPGQNKKDFINHLTYREDYMQYGSGKIEADGIKLGKGFWSFLHVTIYDGELNVYSDKLKQAGAQTLEPLPAAALKNMHAAFLIDTLQLNNNAVHYTELNADTKHTGHVDFTNINGNIKNITPKAGASSDSLRVTIFARFLDTLQLQLQLNESYNDPLGGLNLRIQLGHGDMRLLNPFLAPLASFRVRSGYLDSMDLFANGNEYTSTGTMSVYYHKLKADILDSGSVDQRKFGTKLSTFFANTFAIHNNNNKRSAHFYFVRDRKKSSIAFFIKMIVEGSAENIAPVTKIVYRKQYKKEVKKLDASNGNDTAK